MQSGQWQEKMPGHLTIGSMLKRYLKTVTPTKRDKAQETRRLYRLLRETQLMSINLEQAKPCTFIDLRDRRIHEAVRTCQYDLVLMHHA